MKFLYKIVPPTILTGYHIKEDVLTYKGTQFKVMIKDNKVSHIWTGSSDDNTDNVKLLGELAEEIHQKFNVDCISDID